MIHPRLLEEMLEQAEEYDCKLVFCGYTLSDGAAARPGSGLKYRTPCRGIYIFIISLFYQVFKKNL